MAPATIRQTPASLPAAPALPPTAERRVCSQASRVRARAASRPTTRGRRARWRGYRRESRCEAVAAAIPPTPLSSSHRAGLPTRWPSGRVRGFSSCALLVLQFRRSDAGEFLDFVDEVRLVGVPVGERKLRPGHLAAFRQTAHRAVEPNEPGAQFGRPPKLLQEVALQLARRDANVAGEVLDPPVAAPLMDESDRALDQLTRRRQRTAKYDHGLGETLADSVPV